MLKYAVIILRGNKIMQIKEELNARIIEELNRDIGDVALNLRSFINLTMSHYQVKHHH